MHSRDCRNSHGSGPTTQVPLTNLGTRPVFARSSYHRGILKVTPPPRLSTPLSASTCFIRTLQGASAAARRYCASVAAAGGGAPVDAEPAGVAAAGVEAPAPAPATAGV